MPSAIGQAGSLNANTNSTGQAINVTFDQPLTDPVVAIFGSNFGGHKYSFRVIEFQTDANGDATGFSFTFDEWENHDGRHPAVENVNWLAIESGVHTLPDGRTIEAGYVEADSDGEQVTLAGSYTNTPTVLTTVASDRLPSQVDSDPFNISTSGFTVNVEEAESQDGVHGLESVGWISVEPGNGEDSGSALNVGGIGSGWVNNVGLGDTFDDAVTVGETQTQNDSDTGNVIFRNQDDDEIDIRFEEDTSVDGDSGHTPEVVGLVTFENGLIMCFTPGTRIETALGARDISELSVGDLIVTRDHGLKPLRWIAETRLSEAELTAHPNHRPILLRAGAIAPGCPERDTVVSPQHRMLLEGWRAELYAGEQEVLAPAVGLLNDHSVLRAPVAGAHYIHLLFDSHQVICGDGAWSESLHPAALEAGALDGAAREELFSLFPTLRAESANYGPTARLALTARQAMVFA